MRNFVGGLLGIIIGSVVILILLEPIPPIYPQPFDMIWFLLAGNRVLQNALFEPFTPLMIVLYIGTWVIIGLVIGLFSKPGWNAVRSAIWVGLINAIFALISLLLLDPGFWVSPNRNVDLLYQFVTSILLSTITIPFAFPMAILAERLGRQAEPPIPVKIETVCECGAIFKSNPMICSECGRKLDSINS